MHNLLQLTVVGLVVGSMIYLMNCEPRLVGPNVCNKTFTIKNEKNIEEPVKYEIKYQSICGILPCTKTRTESRIDTRLKVVFEETTVATCCPGYTETPDRHCAPICLISCNNGKCVAPNVCRCTPEPSESSPGYTGTSCDRFTCLTNNRWGSKCDKECNCPVNSYCSASTGKCLCRNGWRGSACEVECDSSMNCDNVELPPIVDPEVNLLSEPLGRSQKLEDLTPKALQQDMTDETAKPDASLVTAHMSINLALTLVAFTLLFAVFWYKKRLTQLKNEIYYTYSSRTSGSDSNYSPDSNYTIGHTPSIRNRPRMPAPNEPGFLGKNLNFDSATRTALMKETTTVEEPSVEYVVDKKVESHLTLSQKSAQQNIYSDLIPNFDRSNPRQADSTSVHLCSDSAGAALDGKHREDHVYQVPRSFSVRSDVLTIPMNEPSQRTLNNLQGASQYENESSSDIYEEIKPTYLDREDHN